MRIVNNIAVPTGNILIGQGEHGLLEFLSLGDYGKDVNLNQNKPAQHTNLLPLEEKWVITVSTQYGCSMGCSFCDAPLVGAGKNATFRDIAGEILSAINLHPEVEGTKRLNVHFARMGEPTWNPNVLDIAKWLKVHIDPEYRVHPVVSTMMPRKNIWLKTFIHTWMRIKNRVYRGEAGLQLSINSTNEKERAKMFNGNASSFWEIQQIMDGIIPNGRKITLNFAVAEYEISPEILLRYFNPNTYVIKLTPMHVTLTAAESGIKTPGDYTQPYPYEHHAKALRDAGYEVLVFIASREEDEGRITCGNAILSGTVPFGAGKI